MQPPFHVTGDAGDWIILIVGALVCLYWLRVIRLAREGVRLYLRNLTIAVLVFFGCKFILTVMQIPSKNVVLISFVVALCVFVRRRSIKRSRYIPRSVKRAVIARDLKGGQYDSKKYHLDHVQPFSKGGSNTTDNLRAIPKEKNLKKGAKRPHLWEMW